jgi:hypothetical protein
LRLPSGEETRLRFLGAWSKPDVFALMDSSILSLHVEKKIIGLFMNGLAVFFAISLGLQQISLRPKGMEIQMQLAP